MAFITVRDLQIEIDEDGFIQEPAKWSEEVARVLAASEGVDELNPRHWQLINYLRDYYQRFGIAPMIRKMCKEVGMKLAEVYALFPSGPAKGACKAAGLPKPTGCV